jgi:hypothetical protein
MGCKEVEGRVLRLIGIPKYLNDYHFSSYEKLNMMAITLG